MRQGIGLLSLLLMAGMAGGVPVPPERPDPEPLSPPDPPKDPTPEDPRRFSEADIPRRCAFHGCGEFARWRPVLLMKGLNWRYPVPFELAIGVCQEHRIDDPQAYLPDLVWKAICEQVNASIDRAGNGAKPCARHLTKLDWLPLLPVWREFQVDGTGLLDMPSKWVGMVRERAMAQGCEAKEAALALMDELKAQESEAGTSVFCFHEGSEDYQTLGEWAWDNVVDLLGWLEVAESLEKQASLPGDATGTAPEEVH